MQDFAHDSIWMRRLARSLVGDHVADDVVQDAWLKVRDKEEVGGGYLAQVVRSLASHWRRGEGRRAFREVSSSRPEALPSTDEVAARIEVAQRLSAALNELDEPYRTTLVLHFYDGLSSAEIARRSGTPAGTIRARLKRGLDTLRARLDADSDSRASWLSALLPLARMPITENRTVTTLATASVVAKLAVGTVLVVATGLLIRTLQANDGPGPPSLVVQPSVDEEDADDRAVDVPDVDDSSQVARVEQVPDGTTGSASATEEPTSVTGIPIAARIVDEDGRALASGWLRIAHRPEFEALADEDGRITAALAGSPLNLAGSKRIQLVVGAHGRRTRTLEWPAGSELQLGDVVLEPGGTLVGRVVDETGIGLEGAVVAFGRPIDSHADPRRHESGPPDLLRRSFSSSPRAIAGTTERGGAFQLDGLPIGFGTAWARTATSTWTCSEPIAIEAQAVADEVVLVVRDTRDKVISGRVVDPEGRAVPGVELKLAHGDDSSGWWNSSTDAHGRFHFVPSSEQPLNIDVRSPSWEWEHTHVSEVEPGTHDITITFEHSHWFEVLVQDEQGAPVSAGRVAALPTEGPTDRPLDRGESTIGPNGTGRLRRSGVAFRVLAEVPGYRNALVGPFDANLRTPVTIVVEALPALVGTVFRADGHPAAGANVSLHRGKTPKSGNLAPGQTRSSEPGHLTHQGWPGDRDAFVYGLFAEPTVSVRADENGDFRLPLPGIDVDAVGEIETEARGFGGLEYAGRSSQRPSRSKPSQPWYVHASLVGEASRTDGPHWFDEPQETRIDLELPRSGEIHGELVLEDETSPLGWVVRASDGMADLAEAKVGVDGSFRLADLHAGGWQVRAFEPGRSYSPSGGRLNTERRPEPDVTVIAGRAVEYRHETRRRNSARLFGELLIDGEAPGAWVVRVSTSTRQGAITSHDLTLDAEGRFRVTLEPDQRTTITVMRPGSGGFAVIDHPTIVVGRNEWSVHVNRASIEGTIDPAQLPETSFRQITYVVEIGSAEIRTVVEPDAEGRVAPTEVSAGHGILHAPQHDFRKPPAIWAELDLEPGQTKTFQVR